MNVGEDDLFLQRIMTPHNTSVVLSPRATLRERIWGGMGWWIDQAALLRRHEALLPLPRNLLPELGDGQPRDLLPRRALRSDFPAGRVQRSPPVCCCCCANALVAFEVRRLGQRLGETDLWRRYFLYDLWSPLQALWIKLLLQRKDPRVWR